MEYIDGHIADNNIQYIKFSKSVPKEMFNEFCKYKSFNHYLAYDLTDEEFANLVKKYKTCRQQRLYWYNYISASILSIALLVLYKLIIR